ncbi:MAG: hypothetical protein ACO4AU_05445 [bacterium]
MKFPLKENQFNGDSEREVRRPKLKLKLIGSFRSFPSGGTESHDSGEP